MTDKIGVFCTEGSIDGESNSLLDDGGDEEISKSDTFTDEEGLRNEMGFKGVESASLTFEESGVCLHIPQYQDIKILIRRKDRTDGFVVRECSSAERADKIGERVNLSLCEVDPLVNKGSIFSRSTKETSVRC